MKTIKITVLLLAALTLLCGCKKKQGLDSSFEVSADNDSIDISVVIDFAASYDCSSDTSKEEKVGTIIVGNEIEPPTVMLTDYVYDNENIVITKISSDAIAITKYTGNATKLIIPSEIDGKRITHIHHDAFYGNTKLEGVYIEDGIEEIGVSAFGKCISLKELRLPYTLKLINVKAFAECIRLQKVYIPDGIKNIYPNAFIDCKSLRNVRFPAGLEAVYSIFDGCVNLRGEATMPSAKGKIYGLYSGCPGITKVIIPEGGTELFPLAFKGMTALEEVHIPESVIVIENIDKLFADCPNLKRIYVKDGSYAAYMLLDSVWGNYLCSEVEDE